MRIPIRSSRWAIWAGRLARLCLPVLIVTVFLHREGILDSTAFMVAGSVGLALGLLALLFGLAGYARIWITGDRGWRRATWGVVTGLICLGLVVYGGVNALRYPALADVTTDFTAPPVLSGLSAVPAESETQAAIRAAFPNAASRLYPLPAEEAYAVARDLALRRGWQIAEAAPGSLRATEVTLFGWRDEIAIRVTENGAGARVDMRSARRGALHDLGANGRRIEAFLLELDDLVTERTHELGLVAPAD